jgi:hypothetical protein
MFPYLPSAPVCFLACGRLCYQLTKHTSHEDIAVSLFGVSYWPKLLGLRELGKTNERGCVRFRMQLTTDS